MSFDLRQARHFLAACDSGSITRAADETCVTQPALSHSIRKLEESLGTKLFNRLPSGLELTESGRRFEVHARSIIRAVEQAQSDLRHLDNDPVGPINLGVTIGLAELVTIPMIERVRNRFPGITLSITESSSGQIVEKVKIGALDVALSFVSPTELLPRKEKLANDQYLLCGRRDRMEELGLKEIRVLDLVKLPMVMMGTHNGQRSLVESEIGRQGGKLNVVAEIDTTSGLKRAMLAGLAFSAFPLPSLYPELQRGIFAAIPIVEPIIRRPLYLLTLPHGLQFGSVRAVAGELRSLVAEIRGAGNWGGPHMNAGRDEIGTLTDQRFEGKIA
ncbi:LysR family transcriptional regulator [Faunimonas sp. B44]|uniref:LysR family transcriptional regulator n=1 Tax=Faunimonas sp. B44 TaxID=3461493 RepID=UPI004043DABA